ncbi:MAG: hypothetical protein B6I37_08810 [Desulfobacteraceae bacterium 4572_35.2]|nr:MAG: hypothetical protein B6I37_08810 [Desulfobacteraceae bacterium 4572_35.2]
MLILVSLVVFLQLLISGAIFTTFIGEISQSQIGKRALDIAHTVAAVPLVATALTDASLQPQVQQLAETVDCRFCCCWLLATGCSRHRSRLSARASDLGFYVIDSGNARCLGHCSLCQTANFRA